MNQPPLKVIRGLLRPVVSFCIRRNIRFQDIVEAVRLVLIEEGLRELQTKGERVSESKLSAMTGVHRKEVKRLLDGDRSEPAPKNLVARVLGLWEGSADFAGPTGPRPLTYAGRESEFAAVVNAVTSDLNPATVLFELERLGLVRKEGELLHLVRGHFVPRGDPVASFGILSKDMDDLLRVVEHNTYAADLPVDLHGRTEYDNIPSAAESELRAWMFELGNRVHAEARAILGKLDRDVTPPAEGADREQSGRLRVVLSTFGRLTRIGEGER